uniref:B-cell receptor CD22 n=1 Tax=Dicentrarchus labrax TaxID=13489 RepID=A0A8C4H831_DICLA
EQQAAILMQGNSMVQGQEEWGVTYNFTEICALKGSTVDIRCNYRYPSWENDSYTEVEESFWFTKMNGNELVDLRTDPEYSGRVQYISDNNNCTLRITDLRESDSAEYKFRFTTNQTRGEYSGSPGVTLSVTDAPRVPSVSVSPSGEIVENSSVTLTCSSDANPAANYTWYKRNGNQYLQPPSKEPQLVFRSIQPSDSGEYYCTAENELGRTSNYTSINVKYPPRVPSVSVRPSGEIVEGSSVNLTCSSDANPAANYTWYKENQTLFQGPEGIHNFTSISSEDRGIYHCSSENQYGQIMSSPLSVDVQCKCNTRSNLLSWWPSNVLLIMHFLQLCLFHIHSLQFYLQLAPRSVRMFRGFKPSAIPENHQ